MHRQLKKICYIIVFPTPGLPEAVFRILIRIQECFGSGSGFQIRIRVFKNDYYDYDDYDYDDYDDYDYDDYDYDNYDYDDYDQCFGSGFRGSFGSGSGFGIGIRIQGLKKRSKMLENHDITLLLVTLTTFYLLFDLF